jgi:iron-sulfur cluster assembly protein
MSDVQYSFSITPKAAEQVKKQLEKRGTPDGYLRIGLRGGLCSGFGYVIQFEDNEPREHDIIFSLEDISVLIDKKSIIYLNGATLDWEQSLMRQGFSFRNPNSASQCGCGESFSPK